MTRAGSLCSGVGGLDLAIEAVFGAETVWQAEVDKHAALVLEKRWPGVPNLGDITAVDWSSVEPVDVLSGGTPCQDMSSAGRRAGMRPGTRSGLWSAMADAIYQLRPRVVVWENVEGALSACAHDGTSYHANPDQYGPTLTDAVTPERWGRYAAAVARHEAMLGRPAPSPTVEGRNGNPVLSHRFTEWMMMWPDGWVSDLLDRRPGLRCCGNGVVPAQATAAIRSLLAAFGTEVSR